MLNIMSYTTIKIPKSTHQIIKELTLLSELPQQQLIYNSLQEYKKKLFWEQCNSAYSKLNNGEDSDSNSLYDNTLMDGLEDEY